ncbi:hypothetical protein A4H97_17350 [Niastella yeongjuensis]|uniref:Uncharacterized protein n=1 Tax=Niastella yeongjuensis TaxID=354355 RepID=A0A1V9E1H7_9BACT|nr:hypothetical protein [Niastella yeongjuensis]OQP39983.1 hypothetical protein A4H97_17350 [Niastella yeongjuensis]SEO12536.1 hypothetical protein SAMN05660816_02215 [Niastella yeongjuensis]
MKQLCTLLFFLTLTSNLYCQFENGLYKGLERICWTDEAGKVHYYDAPRKWYHENLLLIDNDSIFMYKVPLKIVNNQKNYSAADGAFYYYYGAIQHTDTGTVVNLTMNNCDYCGHEVKFDSATGFMYPVAKIEKYKLTKSANGIQLGGVDYNRETGKLKNGFPPRQLFYIDSNSIYRVEPKGQYGLISTAIKNFLQTKDLILDGDTLRISLDRYNNNSLIETLDPANIKIDTTGILFCFYTQKDLKQLAANSTRPIRYIEVGQIIDYWKAARVYLKYRIALPKTIHQYSEKQFSNLFEYNKVETEYMLADKLHQNNWERVEQL